MDLNMWHLIFCLLSTATLTLAGEGYHYPAPFIIEAEETGHYFPAISTISPLPPVPNLPPLPTGRPNIQQLVKIYPSPRSLTASPPVPRPRYAQATGAPVRSQLSRITQSYYPAHQLVHVQPNHLQHLQQQPQRPQQHQFYGPSVKPPPSEEPFYLSNGRPVKQYAVVEIIDNDIQIPDKPFLTQDFFNPMRARIGGSGIGATAFSGAPENQYQGRANALLLEQQRIAQQLQPLAAAGDRINLGSGGLGYIRLANGNVFLGSGSLGYISGQEHNQSVLEARNRAEINSPDALHFGHGRNNNFFPNK